LKQVKSFHRESGEPSGVDKSDLELAVIIPTYNERANVLPLLGRLEKQLAGIAYEVIFVDDDSSDQTAALIRQLNRSQPRVRVLQRIRRRGLASACVEGMLATSAPYLAVMDADLQHDESILPLMLAKIKTEGLDLVVGTRNAAGGSMGDFAASRARLSNWGLKLSTMISHCDLSDPMSGYFVLDRRFLEEVVHSVSAIGFKILLDIVSSATRPVKFAEVPYRFGQRLHGESKLDILVGIEYLQLLFDKTLGNLIPPRFFLFGMVGALGVAIHLSVLYFLLNWMQQTFVVAQTSAIFLVMTLNFFLNNMITYRDRRLRGPAIFGGLLSFYLACSVGAFVGIRIAAFGVENGAPWYIAGFFGLVISSVWNYAATAVFTWRQRRRQSCPATKAE